MRLCRNVNSHKSKSGSKMGHVGSKAKLLGQIMKKNSVYTQEGTVLIKSL